MIKSKPNESRSIDDDANDKKQFVCWNKDAQAQALRVELNVGGFFIFPYTHFTFAMMEREEINEVLTISFTTHDLRIVGRNLRELGVALQKMSVDWIKEAPVRYAPLAVKEIVFIEAIEVKEVTEQILT